MSQELGLNFMFDKTMMFSFSESSTRFRYKYIRFLKTALKVLTPAATNISLAIVFAWHHYKLHESFILQFFLQDKRFSRGENPKLSSLEK